jgi:prepilin-type N-terminal cleavage/methylation domain-containing protein
VREERGYTLVEIMLALVIMLVVAGALHNLLLTTQRLSRKQASQADLQSNMRAGSIAVANELRELSTAPSGTAAQNDILRIAPAAVTYRAMRGVGFLCQAPTATGLRIARQGFTGHRDPQPGRDTAYVFVAGGWLPLAVTGVSTGSACPASQGAGISLTIANTPAVTELESGTPVRITELMELRLYRSEGKSWLGARSVSAGEPIQPVVGPLSDGNGFALEYLNGAGVPTVDLTDIQSIRITLRGLVEGSAMGSLDEQLTTAITLRNGLGP